MYHTLFQNLYRFTQIVCRLRTCGLNVAQQQPANTRSGARAQEMDRVQVEIWSKLLYLTEENRINIYK